MMSTKKRNVCIVTFFGSNNYGSNLQAIGLAKAIEKTGRKVFFLKRFNVKKYFFQHPVLLFARVINRINRNKSKAFFSPSQYTISREREKRIEQFTIENFDSLSVLDSAAWEKIISQKMIFVSGSDIIWNPARGYPTHFFLDFAYYAGLKRFSYASSVGSQSLPHKYYKAYKKYLSSMVALGVREQAVADMLEPIIDKKIQKVVDPSFLLTAEEWNQYSARAKFSVDIIPNNYIFCYFVMEDRRYWEYVKKVSTETNMKIVVLPMHHLDEEQPYSVIQDGTPYEFLWLIKNASFICTDSFHVCAFSIQYKKEFYLLSRARKAEDAKFDDLLKRYKLEDRKVTNETVFERKSDMDYTFADEQLQKDRASSILYLKNALVACE